MSDASPTPSRTPPISVYLLAEHLDAALAAGEDLAKVRYAWSGPPARTRVEIETIRAAQRLTVERLHTYELTLLSRLLKGREWATAVAAEDERFAPAVRLFLAGTASLVEAVAECGNSTNSDFDTGNDPTAYLRSRGLIAEDAPALVDAAPIAAGDGFLIAKRIPLGVLLDLVSTFLDALEAEFDLFTEPDGEGGEQASSPPAATPVR